jgi:calcineurin-like phosphoesterase family protein
MMKAQFFSDLHVGVGRTKPISVGTDVDVAVVAGDTCEGVVNGFETLRRFVPERIPIVTVAGNHEFYRRCYPNEIEAGKAAAPDFNVHFLSDDSVVVNGVRFLGCTLWTDYALFGADRVALAMEKARTGLNDHRVIAWQKKPWLRFRPEEALVLHGRSRQFLRERLSERFDGPTVVLTHHAPLFASVEQRFRDDILTAAFASDLSDLIDSPGGSVSGSGGKITLWNHGHMHSSSDYVAHGIRVLANPHGYGDENPRFDPSLTVEI